MLYNELSTVLYTSMATPETQDHLRAKAKQGVHGSRALILQFQMKMAAPKNPFSRLHAGNMRFSLYMQSWPQQAHFPTPLPGVLRLLWLPQLVFVIDLWADNYGTNYIWQ